MNAHKIKKHTISLHERVLVSALKKKRQILTNDVLSHIIWSDKLVLAIDLELFDVQNSFQ